MLNANSLCWDSVLSCWCYGQVENCHYLPPTDIPVLLVLFSKALGAIQPLLAGSQYCVWPLHLPFLCYHLTHVLTARCNQMFGGTSVGAGTESLPALWWHLQRYTNLPVKTISTWQPLFFGKNPFTCRQALWYLCRYGSTQPGKQHIRTPRAAHPNPTEQYMPMPEQHSQIPPSNTTDRNEPQFQRNANH